MAKAELFQKDIPKKERVFYYESETDDPIQTKEQEKGQEVRLPEGYQFIPKNPFVKLYSAILFRVFKLFGFVKLYSAILFRVFKLFGRWYEKHYWQANFYGREKLKEVKKSGYVMYANHTNPFHDVFGPAIAADRRILPYIGGLPLGKTPEEKKAFHAAADERLRQGNCLVIYPEAHLWPYYTKVRKFPAGDKSFTYAARNNLPIFTMTTTYHKRKDRKHGDLPRMDIYVDGPFYPDSKKSEDENRAILAKKAYDSMVKYSKNNSYEYFEYRKKAKK